MKKLLVSPSPHIHGKENTTGLMRDVIIALLPAVAVMIWFFGLSALKLVFVGVLSCVLVEFLIEKFVMKSKITISDHSAIVTGLLLALNLPPSAPWWIIVIGAIVAIGIAKMTFGGLGQNLFNPALVGRVFLLISFPVIMTDWTVPSPWFASAADAFSGATPLSLIKEGIASGKSIQDIISANNLTYSQMLFARMGGSSGEISSLALLIGFAYLLFRRVIKPHIPLAILGTIVIFSGILWLVNPAKFTDPLFNILTGGVLLGAIFMATDYVTSPMSKKGMIIFGVGIGIITILIRQFGSYPEGVSFAILIMNATVPLINMYCKPKRFGRIK
jgi:electron transport complex, RnfABCDGE type, D subunit